MSSIHLYKLSLRSVQISHIVYNVWKFNIVLRKLKEFHINQHSKKCNFKYSLFLNTIRQRVKFEQKCNDATDNGEDRGFIHFENLLLFASHLHTWIYIQIQNILKRTNLYIVHGTFVCMYTLNIVYVMNMYTKPSHK